MSSSNSIIIRFKMSSALSAARMSYAAAVVGCVTYGFYALLSIIAIHYLAKNRRRNKSQRLILAYTVSMFVINTVYFVASAKWSEIEFVESTVNPGVFATLEFSPVAILKNTTFVVCIWLADSLIIYRVYVIWQAKLLITIMPIMMWLSSIATGIGLLVESSRPGGALGQTGLISFGTPFYCLSIALNIVCTLLISGRLWNHHRKMSRFDFVSRQSYYMSIAMIVIESAALYSVAGIIYVPLFILNLPLSFVFSALLGSASVVAPTLIILRMALGIAITKETAADPLASYRTATTMNFRMGTFHAEDSRQTGRTAQTSQTAFETLPAGKSGSVLDVSTEVSIFPTVK